MTENHGVGGSIPPLGTTKIINKVRSFGYLWNSEDVWPIPIMHIDMYISEVGNQVLSKLRERSFGIF